MFKLLVIIAITLFSLAGCADDRPDPNSMNNTNSSVSRTDTIINVVSSENTVNQENNKQIINITKNATDNQPKPTEEKEIAYAKTPILVKESGRQNNIKLTCDSLNGTRVEDGETFSFCNTVGKATTDKGYEKADVFDTEGNVTQGLGGGNCQVSSTLYNAVLKAKEDGFDVSVIERHEHSRKVTYVPKGKDAAVAYGSVDFKFKNTTGHPIIIYASSDGDYVYTQLDQEIPIE